MDEKEKKVVISYTVTHYSDGSTEVVPVSEGTDIEGCYDDIEYTAKLLDERRQSNRVYLAARKAMEDMFKSMAAARNSTDSNE